MRGQENIERIVRKIEVLCQLFGITKRDSPIKCNDIGVDKHSMGTTESLMDMLQYDVAINSNYSKREFQAMVRKFLHAHKDIPLNVNYGGISKFRPNETRQRNAIELREWLKL